MYLFSADGRCCYIQILTETAAGFDFYSRVFNTVSVESLVVPSDSRSATTTSSVCRLADVKLIHINIRRTFPPIVTYLLDLYSNRVKNPH